ncbi:MAG: putative transposase [Paracoccaceae bacterium]
MKAEADAFVASFADEQLEDGRRRIVRHGFGPERQNQTGIGALDVQRPKVRDRLATPDPSTKIRFTSNILPKWARRSVSFVNRHAKFTQLCG